LREPISKLTADEEFLSHVAQQSPSDRILNPVAHDRANETVPCLMIELMSVMQPFNGPFA